MNKTVLAALAAGVMGSGVHAQSNVTLYGIIDAGLTYASNVAGRSVFKPEDGVNYGSRWGLRGSEDLGGGYKAIFNLENGFTLNTGVNRNYGAQFGRMSIVGLDSPYGKVTLGRQYDFMFDDMMWYSVSAYASVYATHQGNFDRTGGAWLNNSIKYRSADYNGFNFGAVYAFSENPGDFHKGSAWSGVASYKNGPFESVAVVTQTTNDTVHPVAQAGSTRFLGATATGADGNNIYSGVLVDRTRAYGIAAHYVFDGKYILVGNWTGTNFKKDSYSSTMNVYELGGIYLLSHSAKIVGGLMYTTFEGQKWTQPTVGFLYDLSKRTSFYVNASYQQASKGTHANQGQGFYITDSNYNSSSSTNKQTTFRVAMVHRF